MKTENVFALRRKKKMKKRKQKNKTKMKEMKKTPGG